MYPTLLPYHAFMWYNDLARHRGWMPLGGGDFNPDKFSELAHCAYLKPYPNLREALGNGATVLRTKICLRLPPLS